MKRAKSDLIIRSGRLSADAWRVSAGSNGTVHKIGERADTLMRRRATSLKSPLPVMRKQSALLRRNRENRVKLRMHLYRNDGFLRLELSRMHELFHPPKLWQLQPFFADFPCCRTDKKCPGCYRRKNRKDEAKSINEIGKTRGRNNFPLIEAPGHPTAPGAPCSRRHAAARAQAGDRSRSADGMSRVARCRSLQRAQTPAG